MTDSNTTIAKQTELLANTTLNLVIGLQQKQPSFLTNNHDLIPTKDDTYIIGNNDNAWKSITADSITILGNSGDVILQSNVSGGGTINLSTGGGNGDTIEIVNTGGNSNNAIDIETTADGGGILITANRGLVNINTNPISGTSDTHIADGDNSGDVYVGGPQTSNVYIGYSNDIVTSNIHITAENNINIGSDELPDININGNVKFLGTVDFTDSDAIGLSGDGFNGKYKASDIELNASGIHTTTIGNELGGTIDISSATDIIIQSGNNTPSSGNINIKTSGNSNDIIQIINEKGNDIGVINVETIASGGGITLTSSGGGTIITDNNNGNISLENIGLIKLDGSTGDVILETDSGSINIGNTIAETINIGNDGTTTTFKGTIIGLSVSGFDGTYNAGNIDLNTDESSTYSTKIGNTNRGGSIYITSTSNIGLTSTINETNAIDLQSTTGGIKLQSTSGGVNINTNDDSDVTNIGSATGGNIDVITQDTLTLQSGNNESESNGKIILRTDGFEGDSILINNKYGIDDSDNKPIEIVAQSGSISINAKNNVNIQTDGNQSGNTQIGNLSGGIVNISSATIINLQAGSDLPSTGNINIQTTGNESDIIQIINAAGNDTGAINIETIANGGGITLTSSGGGTIITDNNSGNISLNTNKGGSISLGGDSGDVTLETSSGSINIGNTVSTTINIGNDESIISIKGNIGLISTKSETNAIDLQAISGGIKLQSTSGGVNINTNDDGDVTYIGSATGGNIDIITQDTLTLQSGNNGSQSNGKIILRTDGFEEDFILINNKYGTDDSDNKPIEIIAQSGSITVDAKNNVNVQAENVISLNAGTENINPGVIKLETNGVSYDFINIINKLGITAAVNNTYDYISDQFIITEKELTLDGAINIKAQNGGIHMNSSGGIALVENGIGNIYLYNIGGGITLNDTGSIMGKPGNIDITSGGIINGKVNISTPQKGYGSLGTTGINLINIQNVYDGSINIQSGAPSADSTDYRGEIIIKTTGNDSDYLNLATKGTMKFDSDNVIQINDSNNGIIITESGNGSIIAQATGSGSVIINSTGGGITIDDKNVDTGTIYIGNSTASVINIGNEFSTINLNGIINNLSGKVYQGVFDPNYNATDINLNTSGSSHQTNIGNVSSGGNIGIASSSEIIITSGNVSSSGKISLETTGTTDDIISIINSNGTGIGYFTEDNDIIYTPGSSAININANGGGAGVQLVSNGGGIILAEQNGGGIAMIEQGGGIIMNTAGSIKMNTSGDLNITSNNKIILDSGYANNTTGSIEILTNGTSTDIIKINSNYSKLSAFNYNNGLPNNWFEINQNTSAINLNTESIGGGIALTSNGGGIAIADMAVENGGGILLTETGGENGGIGIVETGLYGIWLHDYGGDGIHIIESGENNAEISIETNNMGITITDSLLSIGGNSGGINIDGSNSTAINIGNNNTSTINIGHSGSLINLYGTINFTPDNITESSFTGIYDGGNLLLNTNSSFGTTIGNTLTGNEVSIKSSSAILLTTSYDYNEAISLYASTGGINIKSSGGGVNISDTISSNPDAISLKASGSNGGVTIISNGGNVTIDDIASGTINIGDSSASNINIGVHTPAVNTINIGNADSTIYIAGSLYNGGGGPGGSGIVFPYNVGNVELNDDSASIFSTTIGNTASGGSVNINSANEITLSSSISNSDYQDSAINLIASNGGISLSSNSITNIDSFGVEISSFYLGTNGVYMSTTASNISISTPNQENGYQNDNINITNNIGNLPAIDLNTSNIYSPGTSAININAFNGGVQITSNTGGIALYEYSNGGIVIAESGGGIYISENGGGIEIVDQDGGNVSIDSSNGIISIGNAEYDSYYDGFIETKTINIGNSNGDIPSVTTFFGDVDFSKASSIIGLSGGSGFSGDYKGDVTLNTTGSGKTTIGNTSSGTTVDILSSTNISIGTSGDITMKSNTGGININTSGTDAVNIGNTGVTTTFKGTVDLSSANVNSLIIPPKSSVIAPVTDPDNIPSFFFDLDETYSGQTFFINCANVTQGNSYSVIIPLTPGFKCTIIFGGNNGSNSSTLMQIKGSTWPTQIFYGVITNNVNNITKINNIVGIDPGAANVINFNGNSNVGDYVNIDVLDSTHVFVRGFSTADNALACL